MNFRYLFILFWMLLPNTWASAESLKVVVGQFSAHHMAGWESKVFHGETRYRLVKDAETQETVLQAVSHGTASGLFFKKKIRIEQTPWLHWSWKTKQVFKPMDESRKQGDDFVARIYVVVDGGVLFWRTLALNYVWSSSRKVGEVWDNPYTSHATMMAVESGSVHEGQWRHYRRNIRQDLKQVLGIEPEYIDAVAIMTDTDDSGLQAETLFGDIFFTSD